MGDGASLQRKMFQATTVKETRCIQLNAYGGDVT